MTESSPDPRAFLELLVDALRLAALPPNEQVAALPDFVHAPDEVALLYDHAWLVAPQVRAAGLLTEEQYEALARLDRHHGQMSDASDKERLWTIEAMERDDRWERSRDLARRALEALGRPPAQPRFPGTSWVPAGE